MVALLLLPFLVLRFLKLEPYPAILLPSGEAKLTRSADSISFNRTELWVVLEDGSEHRLQSRDFLGDIPVHQWYVVAAFGIAPLESGFERDTLLRSASVGAWTLELRRPKVTPKQRAEAIEWLRGRLRALGVTDAAALHLRLVKATTSLDTGEEIDYELLKETNVQVAQ